LSGAFYIIPLPGTRCLFRSAKNDAGYQEGADTKYDARHEERVPHPSYLRVRSLTFNLSAKSCGEILRVQVARS
jgi:hypothetical protein